MERKYIDNKYKWDLTKIIKDDKEYKEMYDKVVELSDNILKMKGNILSSTETLKEYLELSKEMNLYLEKIYVYSYLLYYSDTTNNSYKEKSLMADKLNVNPEEIILKKLEKTRRKYPVNKAKGVSTKYNKL